MVSKARQYFENIACLLKPWKRNVISKSRQYFQRRVEGREAETKHRH